jgi:hypothetical protein
VKSSRGTYRSRSNSVIVSLALDVLVQPIFVAEPANFGKYNMLGFVTRV